ncbi:hypothetical protein [Phytopseudomonas dryadis]|uniref:Uncharacterized protein n=1 Tax=Phytopseudomonas dryadis TaxID=2487520 RepID=A0A4Q9R1G7_9GAMM|nr:MULTISPECIES: hypothetical protein [Pseudomonas]TBU92803.1 hypothetical protein DNK44_11950 [Pseudomonas dryadis]TBV03264.1 hypothetical protein DNK34_16890 [Pseudomonas dryadis]TBV16362.1 hypothetical protein DNK41_15875 [Pseudomonas sp. FRB 230]
MGINKGEAFAARDIYIDYDFEEVTYRWDHREQKIYVKFYGDQELTDPVAHDNRLYNEALRFGREITREQYEQGFVRR